MINMVKLPTNKSSLFLRVAKGHFATSHSHINYYIDVTLTKFRLSEARAAAAELARTCGLSESELTELLRRKWEGSL